MGLKDLILGRFGMVAEPTDQEDHPYELGGDASVNVVVQDPNDDHADEVVKTPGAHPVREQGSGPIIGI